MLIYKIQNKINGKIYIGYTTKTFDIRFGDHLITRSHIGNALRKYGKEYFETSIVDDDIHDIEILKEKERYWIAQYDCKYPNGYNHTGGGDGLFDPTQDVRDRIGKAASKRNKGMVGWLRGLTKETDERVAKRAIAQAAYHPTAESNIKRSKKTKDVPKSEEWKVKARHPHIMTPEGSAGIAASNNDPERKRKASERFTGDGNPRWLGSNKVVICKNKNCGKSFEVRPNDPKQYCNKQCYNSDPERKKNLSEKGKMIIKRSLEVQQLTVINQLPV